MAIAMNHGLGLYLLLVVLVVSPADARTNRPPAAEPNPGSLWVIATAGNDQVRFAPLGLVRWMRLEVVNRTGDTIYDSDSREVGVLDWTIVDGHGRRLPDGIYACMVTVEDTAGQRRVREAVLSLQDGEALFAEVGRDGVEIAARIQNLSPVAVLRGEDGSTSAPATNGRIASGSHGSSSRVSGVDHGEPAGLLRTSNGRQFPEGTIQKTAANSPIVGRVYGSEGDSNTFYGMDAGSRTSTGLGNSFFGRSAGQLNTTGRGNSFFGFGAGQINGTANNNSFFGASAGTLNTTGHDNAFFGTVAGYVNTTGSRNSFFGAYAGEFATTADFNSFFGYLAGLSTTTGPSNAFFGDSAGSNNSTGGNNSFFGASTGSSITAENNNTFIGSSSDGAAGITNAAAIGYRAKVSASNSVVLGGVNGVNGATAETNVGIGTTNPDRQLTVEGSQALGRFRRFSDTGSSFGPALLFERARGSTTTPADVAAGDYLGKVQVRGRVGGNMLEYGALAFIAGDTSQNGRFAFLDRDIATERVSIVNTGNVGIGTTAPTERLQVVGNLKVSGSILYGAPETAVPDFVFEPGYKLMSIEELERFIARERHLPNVPNASEIHDRGLNLSEFQMKLLEKIEELALYTVEQAKTMSRKDAEIADLKSQNASLDARVEALEQAIGKISPLLLPSNRR